MCWSTREALALARICSTRSYRSTRVPTLARQLLVQRFRFSVLLGVRG